jgi:transposase-like protein
LIEAAGELYPQARWQRCVVHFYRDVFSHADRGLKGVQLIISDACRAFVKNQD